GAHHDELPGTPGQSRVAPGTARVGAPFQDIALDRDGARHQPVPALLAGRANVQDDRPVRCCLRRLRCRQPPKPAAGPFQELVCGHAVHDLDGIGFPVVSAPTALRERLAGIEGWLSDEESATLYDLASRCTGRGVIVEIGSFKGRSTVSLALGTREGASL